MVALWAFRGLVSCEDPQLVAATIRTLVPDPTARIQCQEPRAWHGESNWACTADLRGVRRCFELRDREELPHEVTCQTGPKHRAAVELP